MLKKIALTLFILVIALAIGAYYLLNLYNGMLEAVDPADVGNYRVVEIPSGATSDIIADILLQEKLIHNRLIFQIYVRQHELGHTFMAGNYELSKTMNLEEIVKKLQSGFVYAETEWFTVPEGLNVKEIATNLEEKGLVDGELFLELCRQPSSEIISRFPFLEPVKQLPVDYMLEGYLFPDTYQVYKDSGAEEYLIAMLSQMEKIIDIDTHRNQLGEMGMTVHELLTMASIVEREAVVDYERALIAGVFYNRLWVNRPLESCATVQYALGETKEVLLFTDLKVDSLYNTYLHPGLPPGPIAAPGEASIMAALYPEDSDYYYFNFKYDGTGEHYFSKTLQEHNTNVNRAEKRKNER